MKLASYKVRGRDSFGAVVGEGVVDLKTRLAPQFTSVLDLLRAGGLDIAREAVRGVRADFPLREVEFLPPVLAAGENPLHRHQLRQPQRRLRRRRGAEISQHVLPRARLAGRASSSRSCGRANPSSSTTKARSRW